MTLIAPKQRYDGQFSSVSRQLRVDDPGPLDYGLGAFDILLVRDENSDEQVRQKRGTYVAYVGNAGATVEKNEVVGFLPFLPHVLECLAYVEFLVQPVPAQLLEPGAISRVATPGGDQMQGAIAETKFYQRALPMNSDALPDLRKKVEHARSAVDGGLELRR
jgi:hypothetical protein